MLLLTLHLLCIVVIYHSNHGNQCSYNWLRYAANQNKEVLFSLYYYNILWYMILWSFIFLVVLYQLNYHVLTLNKTIIYFETKLRLTQLGRIHLYIYILIPLTSRRTRASRTTGARGINFLASSNKYQKASIQQKRSARKVTLLKIFFNSCKYLKLFNIYLAICINI